MRLNKHYASFKHLSSFNLGAARLNAELIIVVFINLDKSVFFSLYLKNSFFGIYIKRERKYMYVYISVFTNSLNGKKKV